MAALRFPNLDTLAARGHLLTWKGRNVSPDFVRESSAKIRVWEFWLRLGTEVILRPGLGWSA